MNCHIKVSKILYQWDLLVNPFCFRETACLPFTTRVFGHSAISPFLDGRRLNPFTSTTILTLSNGAIPKLNFLISGRISVVMSTFSVFGLSYGHFCAEEGQTLIFDPLPRNEKLCGNL